jgi:thiol-disulfide isomerase/thioredoxin
MRFVLAIALVFGMGCHRGPKLPDDNVLDAVHRPELKGKPSLVMFVTPTCPHCLATIPHAVEAAAAEHAGLVTVFVAGQEDNAKGVIDHAHFTGEWMVDDGGLRRRYAISSVPYTLVVGADGRARDAFVGEQQTDTLKDAIARAARP